MPEQLPSDLDRLRGRLVQPWIFQKRTVVDQANGLEAIVDAIWSTLTVMLGTLATRAVVSRAIVLASREYPLLTQVKVLENGLDLVPYRSARVAADPATTSRELGEVVTQILIILHRLLGNVSVPLLKEVETELTRTTPGQNGSTDEERE